MSLVRGITWNTLFSNLLLKKKIVKQKLILKKYIGLSTPIRRITNLDRSTLKL